MQKWQSTALGINVTESVTFAGGEKALFWGVEYLVTIFKEPLEMWAVEILIKIAIQRD